MKLNCVMV